MEENKNEIETEVVTRQQPEMKHKSGFGKGVLAGVIGTLAAFAVAIIGMHAAGLIHVNMNSSEASTSSSILSSSVESKMSELAGQINLLYYEDVDTDALVTGLYKGLFEGLDDPYSEYYTEEEYNDMMITTNANYYGIGAGLQQDKDTMEVTITHIYDDSPAQEAGLKEGDIIVKVDDITATDMELSDLVTNIRGEAGTSVHLEIYREGEADYLELDVERANVDIPTVDYKMLEGNIGYIQVSEFAENTPAAFSAAITDLTNQGMQEMIIDLRNNGGGLLTACQKMLDEILPDGVVVYTEDKYGNRQDYTSDAENYIDMPIALLVNGNSASASEIFAGAIRDFDYGTLIGTTTFGKGIVQTIKQLSDGSAFKITVAKYYTPCGDNIHGIGIDPDIELEYAYSGSTEDGAEYDYTQDNQVMKAIETLQEQMK